MLPVWFVAGGSLIVLACGIGCIWIIVADYRLRRDLVDHIKKRTYRSPTRSDESGDA